MLDNIIFNPGPGSVFRPPNSKNVVGEIGIKTNLRQQPFVSPNNYNNNKNKLWRLWRCLRHLVRSPHRHSTNNKAPPFLPPFGKWLTYPNIFLYGHSVCTSFSVQTHQRVQFNKFKLIFVLSSPARIPTWANMSAAEYIFVVRLPIWMKRRGRTLDAQDNFTSNNRIYIWTTVHCKYRSCLLRMMILWCI